MFISLSRGHSIKVVFVLLCVSMAGIAAASERLISQSKDKFLELSSQMPKRDISLMKRIDPQREKLGGALQNLVIQNPDRLGSKSKAALKPAPFVHTDSAQRVQVYIHYESITDAEIRELKAFGAKVDLVDRNLRKIQAWIPFDVLSKLEQNSMVTRVTIPDYAQVNRGAIVTEGKAVIESTKLLDLGFTGKGIKVGILSDGATSWRTARDSGDLPSDFTVFGSCDKGEEDIANCRFQGTCNEGTAMAEIIHDLAPDAEIAVYSVGTSMEFIRGLRVLSKDFDADIIVDDLGFFGEPYFFDGPIAEAVDALPSKVLYVSSAGNSGSRHYDSQQYNSRGYSNPFTGRFERVHSFDNSSASNVGSFYHGLAIRPDSAVRVIMQWEQRSPVFNRMFDFGMVGYDLSGNIVDISNFNNIGFDYGLEFLCLPNLTTETQVNFVSLFQDAGNADTNFKIYFLGASGIEFPQSRGSLFGHPSLERVIAVGAINAEDAPGPEVTFYSSQGPSQINEFDENSLTLSKTFRAKPDVVATDGVSVSGAGGFSSTFFGTSAAAPHVAGLAAQLMSVSPLANSANVRDAIETGTLEMHSEGFDFMSGNGLISAPLALKALQLGSPLPAIILLLGE